MGQLLKTKTKGPEVARGFAVYRLSEEVIAAAYEILVPVAGRSLASKGTKARRRVSRRINDSSDGIIAAGEKSA